MGLALWSAILSLLVRVFWSVATRNGDVVLVVVSLQGELFRLGKLGLVQLTAGKERTALKGSQGFGLTEGSLRRWAIS